MTLGIARPAPISSRWAQEGPSSHGRHAARPICPAAPPHGELLALHGSGRWYCPHQDHLGRPKSHPLGPAMSSRSVFGRDDLTVVLDTGVDRANPIAEVG